MPPATGLERLKSDSWASEVERLEESEKGEKGRTRRSDVRIRKRKKKGQKKRRQNVLLSLTFVPVLCLADQFGPSTKKLTTLAGERCETVAYFCIDRRKIEKKKVRWRSKRVFVFLLDRLRLEKAEWRKKGKSYRLSGLAFAFSELLQRVSRTRSCFGGSF